MSIVICWLLHVFSVTAIYVFEYMYLYFVTEINIYICIRIHLNL